MSDELTRVKEELIGYKERTGGVESTAKSGKLAAAELELKGVREEVEGSNRDKEVLQLERELKAELALMQAQVQRLEGTGSVEDGVGGCGRHQDRNGERVSHDASEREACIRY